MARPKRYHATKKFQKIAHLREDGAHSAVNRMSDSWQQRFSGNTKGFWKASEARK